MPKITLKKDFADGEILYGQDLNQITMPVELAMNTHDDEIEALDVRVTETEADISAHVADTDNPHGVTKAQVGLGNVTNDAQVKRTEMGVSSGVATLGTDGKLLASQLPAVATITPTVVASESEMLDLVAQTGDIAVRTDLKKSFILKQEPSSTLSNWVELLTPTDAVLSVNNKVGNVVLGADDILFADNDSFQDKYNSGELNGQEVEIRNNGTYIQWKYTDDVTWNNLVLLADLKGDQGVQGTPGTDGINGTNGTDGREVQLQKSATHIQWKYDTDLSWTNLVALADLKGDQGIQGTPGEAGLDITWKGEYSPSTHYVINDAVSYNGSSYICVQSAYGVYPLIVDYWNLMAQKGDTGTGGSSLLNIYSINNFSDLQEALTSPTDDPTINLFINDTIYLSEDIEIELDPQINRLNIYGNFSINGSNHILTFKPNSTLIVYVYDTLSLYSVNIVQNSIYYGYWYVNQLYTYNTGSFSKIKISYQDIYGDFYSLLNGSEYEKSYWLSKQQYESCGCVFPPSLTDNGDGTITLGEGTYRLQTTSQIIDEYVIDGATYSLTDGAMNYIVADYNNGTPIVRIITNVTLIDEQMIIPIYSIYRNGTYLHTQDWDNLGIGLANKVHQSIVKTQRYRRESGLSISATGTRNLALTSGIVWTGAVPITLDAIATATDNIYFWYHNAGVWAQSLVTQYNNTQYDNGTNLATLTANRYAVNWVFRGVESQKHLYVVLGTGDYTLSQAQTASVPSLPTGISSHAVLVGKVIVQKSSDTAYSVQSAFDTVFSVAGVTEHNNLTGIQGGTTGEYYHLTSAELTKLGGIAAGAEVNVNADWNASSGDAQILNKPTIPTQYTDEMAQDAVGNILTDSTEIDFAYTDETPSITASLKSGSIDASKLNFTPQNLSKATGTDINTGTDDAKYVTSKAIEDSTLIKGDTLPIGGIIPWATNTAPENWLLCDGRAVSRTTYAALFAIVGTVYGTGDGSTTFNLPNFKGRVPVGRDSAQTEFDTLAETGGAKTHALTTAELASHSHVYTNKYGNVNTGSTWAAMSSYNNASAPTTSTISTQTEGSGAAHNNLQPYIVTNFIIKAFQSSGVIATVVDNLESTSTTNALSANMGRALNENKMPNSWNVITGLNIGSGQSATLTELKGAKQICFSVYALGATAGSSSCFYIPNSGYAKYCLGNNTNATLGCYITVDDSTGVVTMSSYQHDGASVIKRIHYIK